MMIFKYRKAFLVTVFSCLFGIASAQNSDIQKFDNRIAFLLDSLSKQFNYPGFAITIVKDTTTVYTKTYGVKRVGSSDKITPNTSFYFASVSKVFTSMAIMKLTENHQLNLDDLVTKYYPSFKTKKGKFNSDSITVRHLLTHTSGLPKFLNDDLFTNPRQANAMQSATNEIQKLKLQFKPGSQYLYSNVGYDVLGVIIENVSGMKYEDYMSKYILKPIHMNHSTFNEINNVTDTSVAAPHDFKKEIILSNQIYTLKHSASGGLKASVNDMGLYMKACIKTGINDSAVSSLGWDGGVDNGKPYVGKGGNLEWKSRSIIIIYTDLHLGIAVVSNFDFKDWEKFSNQIIDEALKVKF